MACSTDTPSVTGLRASKALPSRPVRERPRSSSGGGTGAKVQDCAWRRCAASVDGSPHGKASLAAAVDRQRGRTVLGRDRAPCRQERKRYLYACSETRKALGRAGRAGGRELPSGRPRACRGPTRFPWGPSSPRWGQKDAVGPRQAHVRGLSCSRIAVDEVFAFLQRHPYRDGAATTDPAVPAPEGSVSRLGLRRSRHPEPHDRVLPRRPARRGEHEGLHHRPPLALGRDARAHSNLGRLLGLREPHRRALQGVRLHPDDQEHAEAKGATGGGGAKTEHDLLSSSSGWCPASCRRSSSTRRARRCSSATTSPSGTRTGGSAANSWPSLGPWVDTACRLAAGPDVLPLLQPLSLSSGRCG